MSVNDKPDCMDVYVDEYGALWRVIGLVSEPSVILEQIEGDAKRHITASITSPLFCRMSRVYRPPARTPFDEIFAPVPSGKGWAF